MVADALSVPLAISATECIAALLLEGFVVIERTTQAVTLTGPGRRIVVVPDLLVLSSAVVDALLEDADLSPARFLSIVSEAPTQTDLAALPAAP